MSYELPGGVGLDPVEEKEENEDALIEEILSTMRGSQCQHYGKGPQLRGAHAKSHGFLWGTFEVAAVPENLRAGLFAQPGSYRVCIRTSSTPATIGSDASPNVRGIALKVLGVPGKKLLASGPKGDEQDFLMITASHVGFGTIKSFRDFAVAQAEDRTMSWFVGWDGIKKAIITAETVHRHKDVLGQHFFSTVPYRLGDEVVKYHLKPAQGQDVVEKRYAKNNLRHATHEQMHEGGFTLDLFVQPRTKPDKQPVEDASVEWKERHSPLVRVAQIVVPKQELDAEGRDAYAEGLRFDPWHALPEHRPLGGLNRARGVVYHALAQARVESHGVTPYEASEDSVPADGTFVSDLSPTALPQHDRAPHARAMALAQMRATYEITTEKLAPLAMCKGVPDPSTASMKWIGVSGEIGAKIMLNAVDNKLSHHEHPALLKILEGPDGALRKSIEKFAESVIDRGMNAAEREAERGPFAEPDEDDVEHRKKADSHIRHIMNGAVSKGLGVFEEDSATYLYRKPKQWPEPTSLEDYRELYHAIPQCPAAEKLDDDIQFARRRIVGPNHSFLQRTERLVDAFPVTDTHLRAATVDSDSLEAAGAEGRLFVADYGALDQALEPVETKDGVAMRFYSPFGLFAVAPGGGPLVPVAVQCGQDPSAYPVVTPRDGYDWKIARTVLEVADMCFFEPITHLALTHLMIEPVALATRRHLAPNHPIARLILAHAEGTISVNDDAVHHLLADGGAIDQTFGATMESIRSVAATAISAHDFRGDTVANVLEARGLGDATLLPDNPYRDDALRIWGAIERWVDAYVHRAYAEEADLSVDFELTSWATTLAGPIAQGGLNKFGAVASRADLVQVLTKIVYTSSAGHASVNFPQWTDAGFAPRMSGAVYSTIPPLGTADEHSYMAILPPLEKAELHAEFLYLLGTLYHTQLGKYASAAYPHGSPFTDELVNGELLPAFQRDLAEVEAAIESDNQTRRSAPYEHLLPSKIPQSINV